MEPFPELESVLIRIEGALEELLGKGWDQQPRVPPGRPEGGQWGPGGGQWSGDSWSKPATKPATGSETKPPKKPAKPAGKPAIDKVPDFKDKDEAWDYISNNFGVKLIDGTVDSPLLPPGNHPPATRGQKIVAGALMDLKSRFPSVSKFMAGKDKGRMVVEPVHEIKTLAKGAGGKPKRVNAAGLYSGGNNEIRLAAGKGGKSMNAKRNVLKVGKTSWAVGGEEFLSVMTHEYGHRFHDRALSKKARSEWASMSRSHLTRGRKGNHSVSKYGSTNHEELFAESFSAYTHPKYRKGMLPKDIESFFDKHVKGQ